MKRRFRLRRQAEFKAAVGGARLYSGRTMVVFALPTDRAEHRVGVTTSRSIKGAVPRNRARRRLREVARTNLLGPDSPLRDEGIRYDVVLIARPALVEAPFTELTAEAEQAARRLSKLKR